MKKNIQNRHKISQNGFTLIELMIATTVFSTVLLIATISIIFVSKTYARSQIVIKTQNNAQAALLNISNAIKFNKTNSINITNISSGYFCVGNNVYTFSINSLVGTDNPAGLFESFSSTCVPNFSGIQMLSNNERLGGLDVTSTVGGGFQVTMTIDYGSNQVLKALNPPIVNNLDGTKGYRYKCVDSTYSVSFCSIDSVSITVVPRLIN